MYAYKNLRKSGKLLARIHSFMEKLFCSWCCHFFSRLLSCTNQKKKEKMNWWIKIKQHDDTSASCESILLKSGVRLLLGWEDFLVQFLQNKDFLDFLNEWCWSFTYRLSHDFHPQQCIIAVLLLIAYIPISILKLPRAVSLQHLFSFVFRDFGSTSPWQWKNYLPPQ